MLLFTCGIGAVWGLLTVSGASLYDLRQIKARQHFQRHPQARRYRQRPVVSVIIPTLNDEPRVAATLQSILLSSYRKLEIIVIDRGSRDETKKLVRTLIAAQPRKRIRLISKRRPVSVWRALNGVYPKQVHGELILCLQPGQLLDRQALSNAVRYFNVDPKLSGLRYRRRVPAIFSTANLVQRFMLLLSYRSDKFKGVARSDYSSSISEGVIYRQEAFNQLLQGTPVGRFGYGSDVVVYATPLRSVYAFLHEQYTGQSRRLTALRHDYWHSLAGSKTRDTFFAWLRLPLVAGAGLARLLMPLWLTYFIYLASALHQPALYGVSWALVTLIIVFAVWDDEQLSFGQKSRYSLLAPMFQIVAYVLSFVYLAATFRGLLSNSKQA